MTLGMVLNVSEHHVLICKMTMDLLASQGHCEEYIGSVIYRRLAQRLHTVPTTLRLLPIFSRIEPFPEIKTQISFRERVSKFEDCQTVGP